MGLMDLLSGAFSGGQAAPPMAPALDGQAQDTGPQGGGLMSALGLDDPVKRALLAHSLAGGLANVKSSPFAMESLSHAMGGSLAGGNKYEDDEKARADKRLDSDRLDEYRKGSLGVAQQNANTNERSRGDTAEIGRQNANTNEQWRLDQTEIGRGRLEQENWKFVGNTPEGLPIYHNTRSGEERIGGQKMQPKVGAGGRDSVFQQRLKIGEQIYGSGTKEAADYAAGIKQLTDADAQKFGLSQAETEIRGNPELQRSFKSTADRQSWKDKRAGEIAGQLRARTPRSAPSGPLPGRPGVGGADIRDPSRSAPMQPPAAAVPEISMGGQGTQAAPYQPQSPEDYAEIEPGSYYLHPDGRLMRKK